MAGVKFGLVVNARGQVCAWDADVACAYDADAFGLLYDRYIDKVYAYVYGRVGHRQTAEDLTADVFVNALRRIGSRRCAARRA